MAGHRVKKRGKEKRFRRDIAAIILLLFAGVALLTAALTVVETIRQTTSATYVLLTFDVEQDVPPFLDTYLGIEAGMPIALEILSVAEVKATFFVTGDVAQRYPKMVAQMAALGEVGGHGLLHENFTSLNKSEKDARVKQMASAIENATKTRPKSFRAPYLAADKEMIDVLKDNGFSVDASALADYPRFEGTILRLSSLPLFYPSSIHPADWGDFWDRALAAQKTRLKKVIVIGVHSWEFVDLPTISGAEEFTRGAGAYTRDNFSRLIKKLRTDNVRFVTASELYTIMGGR